MSTGNREIGMRMTKDEERLARIATGEEARSLERSRVLHEQLLRDGLIKTDIPVDQPRYEEMRRAPKKP